MDTVHIFLQHYWWFIISLLGALLVFLLFVQGGQAMLYTIGRTETERNLIVNSLGRKWELTFTTLVTFGGAFFASYSHGCLLPKNPKLADLILKLALERKYGKVELPPLADEFETAAHNYMEARLSRK